MSTELKNAVKAADAIPQYDMCVKRLLAEKNIIANILVNAVDVYKGMVPEDVVPYIEGEPYISMVPVEPGLTNTAREENGQRVIGLNTENQEIHEGLIKFDIIFYAWEPIKTDPAASEEAPAEKNKGTLNKIILNVEAQKNNPTEYKIINRAVFYVGRLISSQKERDFVNSHYDDIRSVYSIWVCMNMEENSLSHIHLTQEDLVGKNQWKGNLNLMNIIMIGLSEELPGPEEGYELHRLLGALLSQKLTVEEKLTIMETEYHIPVEENLRKDVNVMCNLGEGIEEKAIAIGEAKTEARLVGNMHKNGFTAEQIAAATDMDIKDVEAILAGREPA
ncbi:MAG: hypothetical protein UDQ92_06680 [Lachnospiraceae bacterium]|nr:hypothetical protein [Lachnospiraceae bacterium]